jgi:hypothetical protein
VDFAVVAADYMKKQQELDKNGGGVVAKNKDEGYRFESMIKL